MRKILAALLVSVIICNITACKTENAPTGPLGSSTIGEPSDPSEASAPDESNAPESTPKLARVTVEGTKFMADGKELWINGTNTPWQKWNDFTSSVMDVGFWDTEFERLVADGVNCTRIWVNCDGMNIVRLSENGKVTSVNEEHWEALDALFDLADKHGLYIMPTLLSFDHFKQPVGTAKKWQGLITNKEFADSYAERYVKPFCERYGDRACIMGIDIMNEPDWVNENDECGKIAWDDISYFLGKCAAAVHSNSSILVTVGIGIIKYNSDNFEGNKVSDEYLKELTGDDGAYLDFYSTHYYNWQKPWFGFPCDKSPSEFGLAEAKPCVIGETHNDDAAECGMTLTEKYKSVYDNGWNGIMVWMDPNEETVWYEYALTREATSAMAELIPEKVFPSKESLKEAA
ncbi:MAG: DUF4038 domain-containing protein [Oscillospiraceae bacterium]|nr:DUF4038 domain-containing protein [Oscillospiraceae bacterium]